MKTLLIGLLFLFTFSSCLFVDLNLGDMIRGEGEVVERELSLDEFSKIEHSSSFNVVVSQGSAQSVVAVGQQNIIERLNTQVINNCWDISLENGSYSFFDLTIYITVPEIESVKLNGSGSVELEDFDQVISPLITITGSGNFKMNGFETAPELEVNMNSSGSFYAKELVTCFDQLTVKVSGSGSFHGYSIETEECIAKTSGSGSCYVYTSENLDAIISGSGSIYYKGNPRINVEDHGSGDLRQSH